MQSVSEKIYGDDYMKSNWLINYLKSNPLMILSIAIPLAFIAKYGGWGSTWVFILSTVAVVPMAGLIGQATESLAIYTGPKIGGLLNATLGNAAELIITLWRSRKVFWN